MNECRLWIRDTYLWTSRGRLVQIRQIERDFKPALLRANFRAAEPPVKPTVEFTEYREDANAHSSMSTLSWNRTRRMPYGDVDISNIELLQKRLHKRQAFFGRLPEDSIFQGELEVWKPTRTSIEQNTQTSPSKKRRIPF